MYKILSWNENETGREHRFLYGWEDFVPCLGARAYFHFHPFKIYRTTLGFRACKTCSASAQPRQGLADQLRKSRATAHKPCFRPCTSRLSLRIPISGFGRFPQRFAYLIGNKSIPAVMGGKQGKEGWKTCGPRFSSDPLEAIFYLVPVSNDWRLVK